MPTQSHETLFTEGAAVSAADVNKARFEYTKQKTELSLENERWKHRRYMAWISLVAVLIVTGAMMFLVPESRIGSLDEVVVWFYVSMASIIGVYIGSATMSDIKSFASLRKGSAASRLGAETPYDVYAQANDVYSNTAVDNPEEGSK